MITKIDITIAPYDILFGIQYLDCIAEDIETGEEFPTNTLSFGFVFFTIDIHLKPKSNN